jgi:hypothetical protein
MKMKPSRYIPKTLLLCLLSVVIRYGVAQNSNPSVKKLNEVFLSGATNYHKNKVFVKTDKDIYSPGEKIWFKAEIFNCLTESRANEPELIVMLKGEKGEVIADEKYFTVNGICDNAFTIPSWANEGNVYLIAYTNKALFYNDASLAAIKPITIHSFRKSEVIFDLKWNKSVYKPGDDARLTVELTALTPGPKREKLVVSLFDFNRKIYSERVSVLVNGLNDIKVKLPENITSGLYVEVSLQGKKGRIQRVPIHTTADNITVEFYPEGGSMLANTIQRILYRATDPFGNPIDVSGSVFDQQGNQAGIGKILKKGYGIINLMPMSNQKYHFKIDDEYGKNLAFELPEAQVEGSVFSLIKTEDSTLRAAVVTTGRYATDTLTLVALAKGEVLFTTPVDGSIKNNLQIATSALPQGVVTFVVFAPNGKLLSERLVYNTSNRAIDIDIETLYDPSDPSGIANISIDLSDFVACFGSSTVDVRVADKYNLYSTDQQLSPSFLRYPLQTATPRTVLDVYLSNLELIANKNNHFSINDLVADNHFPNTHTGKQISGKVIDKRNSGVANATVMAIQSNTLFQATTTTDSRGRFVFDNITKSNEVNIKAFSSSGKQTYTVHLDRTFDESIDEIILNQSFHSKPNYTTPELIEYFQQNSELLRLTGSENRDRKPGNGFDAGKLLQSGSSILDVIKITKPFRLDGNQIVFHGSNNSLYHQSGALIVIDGQKMGTDIAALNSITPFDVKSITISTSPADIQRYTGLNSVGIIEITTRSRPDEQLPDQKDAGFHGMARFDPETISTHIWRYQTTLQWQNGIPVDESGRVRLKFPVSEIQTDFVVQVTVESESGKRNHQSAIFSTFRLRASE